MTEFEEVLETILEEYARRDTEGDFDTWEDTDSFVKEKAEVLLAYANLKEEPVSEDLEKIVEEIAEPTILKAYGTKELARRLRNTICGTSVSEDLGEYINELSKQFPEVSFAKLSRIAVRVSRWQQNQDVKNKLPKVINRTDLDEYAYQCAYDMSNDWAIENPTWKDVEDACKLGANWHEEQFEKNRLKHCNSITNEQAEMEQGFIDQHLDKYQRMPTFLDAIEYGMNLQKEQMINKATKWLEENLAKETSAIVCGSANIDFEHAIEEFKKAMDD